MSQDAARAVSIFLSSLSDGDPDRSPLTSQEMIPREPTTLHERRQMLRLRVKEMLVRKMRNKYLHDVNITTDHELRKVRDAAVSHTSIGHASLIESLRQERIARSRVHANNEN